MLARRTALLFLFSVLTASSWNALVTASDANTASFGTPRALGIVHWGVDGVVALDQQNLAVSLNTGVLATRDGGRSYYMCSTCSQFEPNTIGPSGKQSTHDYGGVTSKIPGSSWNRFSSDYSNTYSIENGNFTETRNNNSAVAFTGLPHNVTCGKFACPFRLQGTSAVKMADGNLLQTAIVSWGGNPKSPQATSIVAYTSSDDGYNWQFASVLANASDYTFSEEGPNEHDLTVFANGTVFAVVRMDGGDGPETHPYKNYYGTTSSDNGKTWTPLREIPGVGCARPRLAMLGDGKGPLLLTGGRQKNAGTQGPMLWINWNADGWNFQPYSVSYYHNSRWPGPKFRFSKGVNSTSAARESTCYTSVTPTSSTSALIGYDVIDGDENMGFFMELTVQ